jgi:hypothetical protein
MTRRILVALLMAGAAFGVTIPRPAGEVVIQLPFGQKLLSEYKGKVVILGFIFTG